MPLNSKHISREAIDHAVQRELTRLLFSGAVKTNSFVIVASPCIALSLQSVIPSSSLVLWIALMWSLAGVRFFIRSLFFKKGQSTKKQQKLTNVYVVLTALIGIAWSVLALLPNALDDVYSQSLISFVMTNRIVQLFSMVLQYRCFSG